MTGFYTPPSTQGTIIYPFTGGGTNWGGLSFDAARDVVFVNTSSVMHEVTLIPADQIAALRKAHPHEEISANRGAPFGMWRRTLVSPIGMPCNPPPWGQLHAIDMHSGKILWSVPLGTTEDLAPFSQYLLGKTGAPNLGGPVSTDGGLVFIGAAMDNYLRAFDARTGAELWKGRLPAGGQATPMTYVWRGKQYVVIAAGGHEKLGTKRGDQLIAFALRGLAHHAIPGKLSWPANASHPDDASAFSFRIDREPNGMAHTPVGHDKSGFNLHCELAEDPRKDRVHLLEMIAQIEHRLEFRRRQRL